MVESIEGTPLGLRLGISDGERVRIILGIPDGHVNGTSVWHIDRIGKTSESD